MFILFSLSDLSNTNNKAGVAHRSTRFINLSLQQLVFYYSSCSLSY